MADRKARVETILVEAVEIDSVADRAAFVERACVGDAALRQEVERMITNHLRAGNFLNVPAAGMATFIGPASTSEARPQDAPGHQIGPYKLRELLGEGGMGTVFIAQQEKPVRRKVALKLIKLGMDSREVLSRFEAERQALALMDHPNIAHVLDAGLTDNGRPYFVMEIVKGLPITEHCDLQKLGSRERLELFLQLCRAIQHAHQKGIIHRDLKPSNVLVAMHDTVPVVKVIDFGVAKAIGQPLTENTLYTGLGQMVGTPLYMSPEQAGQSSMDVDTRSDVYSLGVLLYELLTGCTPFEKETLKQAGYDEMRRIIQEVDPPRPSTRFSTLNAAASSTIAQCRQSEPHKLSQQLRGDLDWIVMKALEKDRTRRYESASAFAADVQRYLDDQPVAACPPSAAYRLRKFARRNKGRLLTAVCLAVAIVGILMIPVTWSLARRERDQVAVRAIDTAFTSTRTAFAAGDLPLAEQSIAEAQAVMEAADHVLHEPGEKLKTLQTELASRKADAEAFARFIPLAGDAQSKMGYSDDKNLGGEKLGREALEMYCVLSTGVWGAELDRRYLTAAQKQQVREAVYETLLALADSLVRWNLTPNRAHESLQILSAAEKHHAPTKGLHWVRYRCHLSLSDASASQVDQKKYESTPATLPLDHYLPGHTAGWNGDRNAAIRAYQAALRLQPDHFNSLFFLGERLATEKRYAEAIAYKTCCIALRPDHVFSYLNRAEFQENLGDMAAAEEDYVAATSLHIALSDTLYAHSKLIDFYNRTHQVEKEREAIACIRKTIELAPQRSSIHNNLGLALESKGLMDEAIASYRRAIELDPKFAVAHDSLGVVLERKGLVDEAIASHRKAIELDPRLTVAHNNLGFAFDQKGLWDEGIASYRKAIELEPKYAMAHYNLGYALDQKGLMDEAIASYRKAIELETDSRFLSGLAMTLATAADPKLRNYDEAMILAGRAIKVAPNDAGAWGVLGAVHYRLGEFKEALVTLEKAMELSQMACYAPFYRAMTHGQLGDHEEAVRWYRKGVERMERLKRSGATLLSLRAEAEALLGVSANDPKQPAK